MKFRLSKALFLTHLRYGHIFTNVANPFAKSQIEGWQHKPIRKLYFPGFTCYKLSQISEVMIHETALNGCFCSPLSHMHGLCVRFSALQISRQWMNDLYVEKIYSHFRFSKPRHYQSKSKRFVTSIGNIENTAVSLKLSGQTRLFLAALKISALLLKYPIYFWRFFSCCHVEKLKVRQSWNDFQKTDKRIQLYY